MRLELQQAIDRLEADEFIGADVRLLIEEIRRLQPKPKIEGQVKPKAPRPRDLILDALAVIEGNNLSEVPPSAWARLAKCKKEILTVCPAVTPDEIFRRAKRYREEFPGASVTADALVKWWARCGRVKTSDTEVRLGDNIR